VVGTGAGSGDTFGRMWSVPFPTASTIKLAILYELVKRADEGTLSLDDTYLQDESAADKAIERLAAAAYNYCARLGGAAPETGGQIHR
jgi:beta-lactamase class A